MEVGVLGTVTIGCGCTITIVGMVSGGSSTAGQVAETGVPWIYDGDKLYIPNNTSITINPKEIVAMVLFHGSVSLVRGAVDVSMERNLGALRAASVATTHGDKTNRSRRLHFNIGIDVVIPEAPPMLYQVQRNRSQASRKVRQ